MIPIPTREAAEYAEKLIIQYIYLTIQNPAEEKPEKYYFIINLRKLTCLLSATYMSENAL